MSSTPSASPSANVLRSGSPIRSLLTAESDPAVRCRQFGRANLAVDDPALRENVSQRSRYAHDMEQPVCELGPSQFRFAPVPDSEDTQLFIELSGYANGDLTQALQALDSAIRFEDAGDPEMVSRFLIEFAVVAYCRAFFPSNVRGWLSDHVAIPARFAQLHDKVCAFRNTTVAHSQSELSTTWPMLVIDQSGEPFVRDVRAANVSQTLPLPLVRQLALLIEELLDAIDALLEPVRERLLADARAQDVPESPATLPGLKQDLDSTFKPRTRRKSYPTQQTIYGSITEA